MIAASKPGRWRQVAVVLLVGLAMTSACKTSTPATTPAPSQPTPTTPTASRPASFSVTDLRITPIQADSNQPVSISVLVTNTGDEAGTHEVAFKLNDRLEASRTVTLAGGASQRVTFTVTRELGGSYTVSLGGLSGMYSVSGPEPLEPGESVPPATTGPDQPPPTPGTTTQPPPSTSAEWTIPGGSGHFWRAVHMGGNWGTNTASVQDPPAEYFEYLRDLNVNWVGISVALHVDGSMDDTVELVYEGVPIATFNDAVLRALIKRFRQHGFNVYIHVAFEGTASGEHPFQRWQLGDPLAHQEDSNLPAESWPWRTDHPQHRQFVASFWQSYTDCLVHIARIAEDTGVGLLTLGTETDRLFRSRSGGRWPNHFRDEMQAMVNAVRGVYSGQLGYEMHANAVTDRGFFGPGSDYLVADLGLDVIAVSAYFTLMDPPPPAAPDTAALEGIWENIFQAHLVPLQQRNGNKPIVFTEFGYVDSLEALRMAAADEFQDKVFKDKDGDGLDEGEEAQRSAYEALFNTMDRHPSVVQGAFLWDIMMATDQQWQQAFGSKVTFSIRGKLAEEMVRQRYQQWQ